MTPKILKVCDATQKPNLTRPRPNDYSLNFFFWVFQKSENFDFYSLKIFSSFFFFLNYPCEYLKSETKISGDTRTIYRRLKPSRIKDSRLRSLICFVCDCGLQVRLSIKLIFTSFFNPFKFFLFFPLSLPPFFSNSVI